jgi:hypothetical protein
MDPFRLEQECLGTILVTTHAQERFAEALEAAGVELPKGKKPTDDVKAKYEKAVRSHMKIFLHGAKEYERKNRVQQLAAHGADARYFILRKRGVIFVLCKPGPSHADYYSEELDLIMVTAYQKEKSEIDFVYKKL